MRKSKKFLSGAIVASILATTLVAPFSASADDREQLNLPIDLSQPYKIYPYGDTAVVWTSEGDRNGNATGGGDQDTNAEYKGFVSEFKIPSTRYIDTAILHMAQKNTDGKNITRDVTTYLYPFVGGWDETTVVGTAAGINLQEMKNQYQREKDNGFEGDDIKLLAQTSYNVGNSDDTRFEFDVKQYLSSLDNNDIGFWAIPTYWGCFWQKENDLKNRCSYLEITYDYDAILDDINNAESKEVLQNIIAGSGEAIGIYTDVFNKIYDKTPIMNAVYGQRYSSVQNAAASINEAIQSVIAYTSDIAPTSKIDSGWAEDRPCFPTNFNFYSPRFDIDYSSQPEDYRVSSQVYVDIKSSAGGCSENADLNIVDTTSKKVVGYIHTEKHNTPNYTTVISKTDDGKIIFVLKYSTDGNNMCIKGDRLHLQLGYDKTAIIAGLNDAETASDSMNIVSNYGKFLGIEAEGDALASVALNLFLNKGTITLDNVLEKTEGADVGGIIYEILADINAAEDVESMSEIAIENAGVLGIDLNGTYSKLQSKNKVWNDVFDARGEGYIDAESLIAVFNRSVSKYLSTTPFFVTTLDDYFISGQINGDGDWVSAALTKWKIGKAVNTTSHHITEILYKTLIMDRTKYGNDINGPATMYEIESTGNWNDYDPTSKSVVENLPEVQNPIGMVAQVPFSNKVDGEWIYGDIPLEIDMTDYFLDENGVFKAGYADKEIALKLSIWAFYRPSDYYWEYQRGESYFTHITFQYDTGAILDEINNADADTISEIISREGSVIGINTSAYDNLTYTDEVDKVMVGKNFANVAEAAAAANAAISSLFYSERIDMGKTGWGIDTMNPAADPASVDPTDFYLPIGNDQTAYYNFNLQGANYDREDLVYAEIGIATRNVNYSLTGEDSVRYLNMLDEDYMPVGRASNAENKDRIKGDVTSAVKAAGDSVRLHSTGVYKDTGDSNAALVNTPIYNIWSGYKEQGYEPNRMYLDLFYNKLDLANKIADEEDSELASAMVGRYRDILGIGERETYNVYATAFSQVAPIKTLDDLDAAIAKAESLKVAITGFIPSSGRLIIDNYTSETITGTVVVATYDADGVMVDAVAADVSVTEDGALVRGLNVKTTGAVKGKAFLWDGLGTMKPLCEEFNFNI